MFKLGRILFSSYLTLLLFTQCFQNSENKNVGYIPPPDLLDTLAQDTSFKSILAIRDTNSLTQEQQDYRDTAIKLLKKHFVIKNNRMILNITIQEGQQLGLHEQDYRIFQKALINSNRAFDSLGINNMLKSFNGQPHRDLYPEKDTLFGAPPFNPYDSSYWNDNIY